MALMNWITWPLHAPVATITNSPTSKLLILSVVKLSRYSTLANMIGMSIFNGARTLVK